MQKWLEKAKNLHEQLDNWSKVKKYFGFQVPLSARDTKRLSCPQCQVEPLEKLQMDRNRHKNVESGQKWVDKARNHNQNLEKA